MSHRRPPLMRALQLNTGVMVVEIAAGIGASSFSLIMDGIHNLSDEVALLLLVLAYSLRTGLSGGLLRFANLFNSAIGLLFILCGCASDSRRRVFLNLARCSNRACRRLTLRTDHEAGLVRRMEVSGACPHCRRSRSALAGNGPSLISIVLRGVAGKTTRGGYALASALTILFVVFNPAGEPQILNLLKGEVTAVSEAELKLLAAVYGVALVGSVLFRREFLLTSFDPDLAFLLTGGKAQWNILLDLLCGLSIAVGVIMSCPCWSLVSWFCRRWRRAPLRVERLPSSRFHR